MPSFVLRSTTPAAVRGTGKRAAETRELASYQRIEIHGPFEVELVPGGAGPAELEGDDNVLPLVRTDVSRGQLIVRLAEAEGGSVNVHIEQSLSLRLHVGNLERIQTHGNARVRSAERVRATSLALDAHGSSTIELQVDCETLEQEVQGSGVTKLSGRAETHSVRASGSAQVHAFDLAAEVCMVRTSGSAQVEVHVTRQLDARASGSSRIAHRGNAALTESWTGKSVIERG